MIQAIKLNLIIRFFRLKQAIKRLDKDNHKEILNAFKKRYNEISKYTKKESGIMAFHRMFLILGLALYKSLGDHIQDKNQLIDKIHEFICILSPKHIYPKVWENIGILRLVFPAGFNVFHQ